MLPPDTNDGETAALVAVPSYRKMNLKKVEPKLRRSEGDAKFLGHHNLSRRKSLTAAVSRRFKGDIHLFKKMNIAN